MKSFYTIENVENILLDILNNKIKNIIPGYIEEYSNNTINNYYKNIMKTHYELYKKRYPEYEITNLDETDCIFKNVNFFFRKFRTKKFIY